MRIAALLTVLTVAAPAAAQAPKDAPKDAKDGWPVEVHGTLRTVLVGGTAVESFGNPNFSAMTAAANPLFVKSPSHVYSSLQVQQSRFSLHVGSADTTKGTFEVDFVHFDQSSPTTAAFPRLRIAQVEHVLAPGHRIFVGQGWEAFSPLQPFTYNLVGSAYQAGNAGFFRQQAGWTGTFGVLETTLTVGLAGANNGPTFGNLERANVPLGTARVAYKTKPLTAGVSGLWTRLEFDKTHRVAWAGNVFFEGNFASTSVRAEGYLGQNTANLGLLTLAMGYDAASLRDAGGYLSLRQKLGEEHALHVTVGMAGILNREDLRPGYTPATATAAAARTSGNGPGIVWNRIARAGYGYSPKKGLTFLAEPYLFQTRHHLVGADITSHRLNRTAWGVEAGAMIVF